VDRWGDVRGEVFVTRGFERMLGRVFRVRRGSECYWRGRGPRLRRFGRADASLINALWRLGGRRGRTGYSRYVAIRLSRQ
jgi:hypothetical protein